jgi:hypothetical protein
MSMSVFDRAKQFVAELAADALAAEAAVPERVTELVAGLHGELAKAEAEADKVALDAEARTKVAEAKLAQVGDVVKRLDADFKEAKASPEVQTLVKAAIAAVKAVLAV